MKTTTLNCKVKASVFLLWMLMLLTSAGSFAQSCANYAVSRATGISYSSIAATGNSVPGWRGQVANMNDDNRSNPIPIGFDFYYLGVRYNAVSVSTNGFLDFSTTSYDGNWPNGDPSAQPAGYATCSGNISYRENGAALYNIPCGNGTSPNSFDGTYWAVAPMYCDLNCPTGTINHIKYKTQGSAPNRVFVLEYISMDDKTGSGADYNFQIKLQETVGTIKFLYGSMITSAMVPVPYSCGLNGQITTNPPSAAQLLTQQADNGSAFSNTVPGMHFATPTSNSRLTFTPPVPADPSSGLTFTGITTSGMTLNWSDWASNETGYAVYISTNGTTYTYHAMTAANAVSYAATGLANGTYYWKVYAVTEGCMSNPATGTQATLVSGTFTSVATGNWSNPATWDLGAVPTVSDNVVISNGHTVTMDGNYGCTALTVGGGTSGTLLLGSSTTGITVTILGDIKVKSGAVMKANNSFAATHTMTVSGNITNAGSFNMRPNATSVCNVTANKNGTQTLSGSGANTTFNLLTLNMGSSSANKFDVTAANFSAPSNFLTLTNGTFRFQVPSNAVTLNIFTSPATIGSTCGIIMNSPNSVINAKSTLTYSGLLTVTSGTMNIGDAADESLISNNAAITLNGGNLNIAGRLDRQSSVALTSLTISSGNLTVNTTGSTSASQAPFTIDTKGSTFNMSGGKIIIHNAGTGNLGYTNLNASTYSFTAGTLQMGDGTTSASQNMSISTDQAVANLVINSTNAPAARLLNALTVSGNVDINSSATLNCNNLNLTVGGNITNDGTFTAGTNTVTFSGAGAQQISGSTATLTLNNMHMNSAGDLTVATTGGVVVNGTLSFTSGKVILNSSDLVIASGNAITGFNSTRYVVTNGTAASGGALRISNLTASRDFPIGATTTSYSPILSMVNNGTADQYSARVFSSVLTNGTSGAVMTANVVDRTWIINESVAGGSNFDMLIQWSASDEDATFDRTNSGVRFYDSGTGAWDIPASWGAATANPAPDYYAARGGSTKVGAFSTHSNTTSLPVEMIDFHVQLNVVNQTDITWATASEINNNVFTVEHSTDNVTYTTLTTVKGAGNSNQVIQYAANDPNPAPGKNYYRIRQTDYNGQQTCTYAKYIYVLKRTTNLVDIAMAGSQNLLIHFNAPADGNMTVSIFDSQGRTVKINNLEYPRENECAVIDCSQMPTGIYYVLVHDGSQSWTGKVYKN